MRSEQLVIIDIETVSQVESFDQLSEPMQAMWRKKAAQISKESELTPEELYFERAAIYAEFGKVVTIAFGMFYNDAEQGQSLKVKAISNHDEKKLLLEFKNFVENNFDASRLAFCAHNGREFDYPYMSRRMLINGIPLPDTLKTHGKKPWEILHKDTMDMWKFGDWKSYTSLELLTTIFGIESSKEDIDGSQVNHAYYKENGLSRIAKYCCNDVIATAQLYLKLEGLPSIEPQNITTIY